MLTETFCTDIPQIDNYLTFNSPAEYLETSPGACHKGRPSGGLAIAFHKSLKLTVRETFKNQFVLSVFLVELRITLIVAYFRPKTSISFILDTLIECMSKTICGNIILGGDFNARLDCNSRGSRLVDNLLHFNLRCINSPTTKMAVARLTSFSLTSIRFLL